MGACLGKLLSELPDGQGHATATHPQQAHSGQHQAHHQQQPHGAFDKPTHAGVSQSSAHGVQYTIEDARVVRVPDGDTFYVEYAGPDGRLVEARVRLMGIDCPEKAQEFGPEARDIGRGMVQGRTVTLLVHTTDQYGRLVADIRTEAGQDYGQEMLRAGAAWHYTHYDNRQELASLMQDAKAARRGLWAYPNPQPPWDYRRAHPRQN
jgi:micrococcal nuclease